MVLLVVALVELGVIAGLVGVVMVGVRRAREQRVADRLRFGVGGKW